MNINIYGLAEVLLAILVLYFKKYFKRVFDIIFSIAILIILSPIVLFTAIVIKLDSNGPIIFKQKRIGMNGRVFQLYKFRSMCVGAEKTGSGVYSSKNDTRVTRVGRIIRATSIDELSQTVNIFKGEMCFIWAGFIIEITKKNLDFMRVLAA